MAGMDTGLRGAQRISHVGADLLCLSATAAGIPYSETVMKSIQKQKYPNDGATA